MGESALGVAWSGPTVASLTEEVADVKSTYLRHAAARADPNRAPAAPATG